MAVFYGCEGFTPWRLTKESYSRLEYASRKEILGELRKMYELLLETESGLSDQ